MENLGRVSVIISNAYMTSELISPTVCDLLRDAMGSLRLMFLTFAVFSVLAIITYLRLK